MAFFDDLGQKISQAGQTAAQKTKEIAEVAKLKAQISDEEKKVNEYYMKIGKLYMSKHKDDYEADYVEEVAALRESEKKLNDHQDQLKDIKGIAKCPKCGAEVNRDSAFCNSCGAAMPAPAPAEAAPESGEAENKEE